jgi:hypothetical protein
VSTITTAAELDALLMAISESAEAAIITQCRRPYLITEDDCGDYWAWSYQIEDEDLPYVSAETLALPWVVIYRPDQPQRTEAQIKAEALRDAAETAEDALSESEHQQWDYDWICYLRETADRLEVEARP